MGAVILQLRAQIEARFESALAQVLDNLAGKDREALARIKHLVRAGLRGSLAEGLAMEVESSLAHLSGDRAGVEIGRFFGRERT